MNKYFREITPEVSKVENIIRSWTVKEWNIFKGDKFLTLPAIEYAFLLYDADYSDNTPEKARDLLGWNK
jgi:hypothetical protein